MAGRPGHGRAADRATQLSISYRAELDASPHIARDPEPDSRPKSSKRNVELDGRTRLAPVSLEEGAYPPRTMVPMTQIAPRPNSNQRWPLR